MSQVIPIGMCKLRDTNEDEVENYMKTIERKQAKTQFQTGVLKPEVDGLNHENIVLDKQINCTESVSQKLKIEIAELKSKSEDAACSLELTKWQIYKAHMLKEFENQTNKEVSKQKFKYEQVVNKKTNTDNFDEAPLVYCLQNKRNDNNGLEMLREKAKQLMQETEEKKKAKENVDSNLHVDIQILKRRNAALILRYQRQIQETESRYRQTVTELNSFQKLLVEKNTLLTNT